MKIQLFIHLLDSEILILNVHKNTTVKNLKNIILKKQKITEDFNIKTTTSLLNNTSSLIENQVKNNDHIFIYKKVQGGFIDILINTLTGLLDLFKSLGFLVTTLIDIFISVIEMLPNIFQPDKLINDIIYAIMTGISTMTGALFGKFTYGKTKPDKNEPGGGIFGVEDKSRRVCITPSFINLMILVLCPPLALYLKLGFSIPSIFMVIICSLMTYYLYYFPGFIFAALHILC